MVMHKGLENKVAVITGASKGIGLAIAQALLDEGALVVGGARHSTPLAQLDDDRVESVEVDLATPQGPQELVDRALQRFGKVDVLINNVGGADPRMGGFLSVSDEQFLETYNFNFITTVRACRAALPPMIKQGSGSIINISSLNARLPQPPVVDYSAAKAAVSNFTKALSEEFSPQGIRVNSISPGPVRTPLWEEEGRFGDQMANGMGVALNDFLSQKLPEVAGMTISRMAEPEEVAAVAILLASPQAAAITGADFVVDCGMSKTL